MGFLPAIFPRLPEDTCSHMAEEVTSDQFWFADYHDFPQFAASTDRSEILIVPCPVMLPSA